MSNDAGSGTEPATETSAFHSPTFDKDISFHINESVGSASISPSGRDVVLASRLGLYIIDLDEPYNPPRHLPHATPWEVADVQWSPFASRAYWVVSTSNQKALVWNLEMSQAGAPIEHVLHAHSRAITDVNFSAHDPDILATCGVDSFLHCWDLRHPLRPALTFADWFAGATQVKWNRQDSNIIASSHDHALHIWDKRKGSSPLVTIGAHATKIYGIDWNRLDPAKILTCSLDGTIKFWDYTAESSNPAGVIHTQYPVWRARHTPFGDGVLAMPQRGDFQLHLYRCSTGELLDGRPVHSFRGHQQPVKEFLWRTRGCVDNDVDDREFQLVSWGADKYLLLQHLKENVLKQVGYTRGQAADKRLQLTRKGATYKTYRLPSDAQSPDYTTMSSSHGLSNMFRGTAPAGKRSRAGDSVTEDGKPQGNVANAMRGGNVGEAKLNPIAWMKGVKISKSEATLSVERNTGLNAKSPEGLKWEAPESLGDEITHVGQRYKNVAFERVDVSARVVSFSLNGPWGAEDSLVHVKSTIHFPKSYPDVSPPSVKIEKTSPISNATYSRLTHASKTICESYVSAGCACFEALVCFLLGERDLNDSIALLGEISESMSTSVDSANLESSSDEEDGIGAAYVGIPPEDLEASGTDILGSRAANANVPLPKACGALWSDDGRLVCFFPPKDRVASASEPMDLEHDEQLASTRHDFQSYGRLHLHSFTPRRPKLEPFAPDLDLDSSDLSSLSSSPSPTLSSRSSSSNTANVYDQDLADLPPLRLFKPHSIGFSQPSSARTLLKRVAGSQKTFISIHYLEHMLPAKRSLAEEYIVFGESRSVCKYNGQVASKHGYDDIADMWNLVNLILYDEVPLELVNSLVPREVFPIVARRVLVHIKRKNSGLDLSFDKPEKVTAPEVTSYVKWGRHPLASAWLIDRIFEHFENVADTQTLAVLASVLAQAHAQTAKYFDTATSSLRHGGQYTNWSISHSKQRPNGGPTFARNYYPSVDVALTISERISPSSDGFRPQDVTTAFGSLGSWSGRGGDSDVTHTPPAMTRQNSRTSTTGPSLSSSPEQVIRRANSNVGNTLAASLSRPFSFLASASSSPPSQSRIHAELSTSAPSSGSYSALMRSKPRINNEVSAAESQENTVSQLYDSDTDEDVAVADEREDMRVLLKNQSLFDDEGYHESPLLGSARQTQYNAYRQAYSNLLDAWGLTLERCEILKLNGSEVRQRNVQLSHGPSTHTISGNKEHEAADATTWDSKPLSYRMHCQGCLAILPGRSGKSETAQCSRCWKSRSWMPCSICAESVLGQFKLCVNCGHIAHATCLEDWLLSDHQPASLECETACGCLCGRVQLASIRIDLDDYARFNVRESVLHRGSKVGVVSTRRRSSAQKRPS